jgi:hypothetical protein
MFNRELSRLWSDATMVGDATILAVLINLHYLLTIQEPGESRTRGWGQEDELRPFTSAIPMPQIVMTPQQPYQFLPLAP